MLDIDGDGVVDAHALARDDRLALPLVPCDALGREDTDAERDVDTLDDCDELTDGDLVPEPERDGDCDVDAQTLAHDDALALPLIRGDALARDDTDAERDVETLVD